MTDETTSTDWIEEEATDMDEAERATRIEALVPGMPADIPLQCFDFVVDNTRSIYPQQMATIKRGLQTILIALATSASAPGLSSLAQTICIKIRALGGDPESPVFYHGPLLGLVEEAGDEVLAREALNGVLKRFDRSEGSTALFGVTTSALNDVAATLDEAAEIDLELSGACLVVLTDGENRTRDDHTIGDVKEAETKSGEAAKKAFFGLGHDTVGMTQMKDALNIEGDRLAKFGLDISDDTFREVAHTLRGVSTSM